MPEFKAQLSPVSTDFTKVRAQAPSGKSDLVGQALGALVQGVEVFGKSSARQAGVEAAQEQEGLDLTQETVNQEVGNIESLIDKELATEMDTVGGPLTNQRVSELKDKALRSLTLTDRHIQSLIDAGTISSTEGNARRRIALSQRMNEGSNFLFKDEFINAMASVTGGSRGAASQAYFQKTPEEERQAAIAEAQNKALAEFEEKVVGLQQIFPYKTRDHLVQELQKQARTEERLKEISLIKEERALNRDEVAESLDLVQANTTRGLEVQIGQMSQENGTLDQNSLLTLKTKVRQSSQAMLESLASTPNLSAEARSKAEADIKLWVEANEARLGLTDATDFNKNQLEDLQTAAQIFGIKSNPYAAVLLKTNPELLKELNVKPFASRPAWLRTRLGEQGAVDLDAAAQYLKDNANFYKDGVNVIEDYRNIPDTIDTEEGLKSFVMPEMAKKYVRMFTEAPTETAQVIGGTRYIVAAQKLGDKRLQGKALDFFNTYRSNLNHTIGQLGVEGIKVRVIEGEGRKDAYGNRRKIVVDLPDDLANIEGTQAGIVEVYKAFNKHRWLWDSEYSTPEDAFNAFMEEEFMPSRESLKLEEGNDQAAEQEDAPLAVKNNNPGNLRSFGDVPQVDTPSGKFAKFNSPEEGMRALARDISTKMSRGDNSIQEIISQYSPAEDPENVKRGLTPESYIAFVEDKTGIPKDKVLTEKDVPKLLEAIVDFESGKDHPFTREQILQGIEDAKENR